MGTRYRDVYIYSTKGRCQYVQSSTNGNSQYLEITQMPIYCRTDTLLYTKIYCIYYIALCVIEYAQCLRMIFNSVVWIIANVHRK